MARVAAVKFALTSAQLAAAISSPLAQARTQADRPRAGSVPAIKVAELPREGRATYELIRLGGPFPSGKDGAVFGNRERQLPRAARGFYREYTVPTPGS